VCLAASRFCVPAACLRGRAHGLPTNVTALYGNLSSAEQELPSRIVFDALALEHGERARRHGALAAELMSLLSRVARARASDEQCDEEDGATGTPIESTRHSLRRTVDVPPSGVGSSVWLHTPRRDAKIIQKTVAKYRLRIKRNTCFHSHRRDEQWVSASLVSAIPTYGQSQTPA
jgi:hypothetical protein